MSITKDQVKSQPLVSATLSIINIVVFLVCRFTGERLYLLGAQNVPAVLLNHEYGRIIWAMFLHSDQYHLFNNVIILFFLGTMIEKEVGHVRYTVFYFLSGICGNLLSLFVKTLSADWSSSIGASGAVFGLVGVLLGLVLFSRRHLPNVTPARVLLMIALSLYSGFTGSNIDNPAHIGGLIAGFLLGSASCLAERVRYGKKRKNGKGDFNGSGSDKM